MKLISWNVNGLRSVQRQKFKEWFEKEKADVVCLQEVKISAEALEKEREDLYHPAKYFSNWSHVEKAGYSGVVTYSKKKPDAVREGLGVKEFDREGRWLETDFGDLTIINSYWPNSQRDHARLPYKLKFLAAAEKRLEKLRKTGRQVAVCGDFNIAHNEIDLRNPKSNKKNAGFLPEERAWMDRFIGKLGWVDTFRHFEKGEGHYTWWSYRPGVREKNVGWRIDYFCMNPEALHRVKSSEILSKVYGSDHCPVRLTLKK